MHYILPKLRGGVVVKRDNKILSYEQGFFINTDWVHLYENIFMAMPTHNGTVLRKIIQKQEKDTPRCTILFSHMNKQKQIIKQFNHEIMPMYIHTIFID